MGSKSVQNGAQELSKTFLQLAFNWKLFSDAFFSFLGTSGTSKIVFPLQRQHDFKKLRFPPRDQKSRPKIVAKSTSKVTPEASRGFKTSIKSDV